MLSLTFKNLWAHKKRLLTSALSVVLGISFLCGSFILTDTLKGLFTDLFSSAVKGTDAMVRAEPDKKVRCQQDPYNNECRANVDASIVDVVRKVDGVATAEGWVQGYAQLIDKKGKLVRSGGAPTFAFSWVTDPELNPYKLRPGSKAPTEDNELGADAAILKKTGYKVGDDVFVNLQTGGKQRFKLVAEVTFGTSDSALGASTLFFSPKRSPFGPMLEFPRNLLLPT
jgi:putative ABC transport system permease protein